MDYLFKKFVSDTANTIISFIRPKILLIGDWDEHFRNVLKIYKWGEYSTEVPSVIDGDVSLVITNTNAAFINTLSRINKNVALLSYDEKHHISIKDRKKCTNKIFCYLNTVSSYFITGHVRCLLQLNKWYLGQINSTPLIISNKFVTQKIKYIIRELSNGMPIHVVAKETDLFYLVFKLLSRGTHYENCQLVNSPNEYDNYALTQNTTLILNYKNKQEYNQYIKNNLMEFSIIFLSPDEHVNQMEDQIVLNNLIKNPQDYYLSAYYTSLRKNLDDEARTRFLQKGDIDKIINSGIGYIEFLEQVERKFDDSAIRFRNIAPLIKDTPYCREALDDINDYFNTVLFEELMKQTNYQLEYSELLSGIGRSTLQFKASQIKNTHRNK